MKNRAGPLKCGVDVVGKRLKLGQRCLNAANGCL